LSQNEIPELNAILTWNYYFIHLSHESIHNFFKTDLLLSPIQNHASEIEQFQQKVLKTVWLVAKIGVEAMPQGKRFQVLNISLTHCFLL